MRSSWFLAIRITSFELVLNRGRAELGPKIDVGEMGRGSRSRPHGMEGAVFEAQAGHLRLVSTDKLPDHFEKLTDCLGEA